MKKLKGIIASAGISVALLAGITTPSHAINPLAIAFGAGAHIGFAFLNIGTQSAESKKILKRGVDQCLKQARSLNKSDLKGFRCKPTSIQKYCRYLPTLTVANHRVFKPYDTVREGPVFKHRLYWKSEGMCLEEQANCTNSPASGHCTSVVHWNPRVEIGFTEFLVGERPSAFEHAFDRHYRNSPYGRYAFLVCSRNRAVYRANTAYCRALGVRR